MKNFLKIVISLLFMTVVLGAQAQDSTVTGQKEQIKKQENGREFVDNNGNGIDDRVEMDRQNEGKRGNGRRDVFIDNDGDGISDGREGDIMGRGSSRKRNQAKGKK